MFNFVYSVPTSILYKHLKFLSDTFYEHEINPISVLYYLMANKAVT